MVHCRIWDWWIVEFVQQVYSFIEALTRNNPWLACKERPNVERLQPYFLHNITSPYRALTVREITRSSSTFSATNVSSNIVWFLPPHDNFVWNFILGTKFSSIYLTKDEKRLLICSVRKMVLTCLMQNIDMCLLYKSHQIARLVSHLINHFSKWMFTG